MKKTFAAVAAIIGIGIGTFSVPAEPQNENRAAETGTQAPFQFQLKTRREPAPTRREDEALRFHRNTLLNRFGNTEARGEALLSFSREGVDLLLRNSNGTEGPVASLDPTPGN